MLKKSLVFFLSVFALVAFVGCVDGTTTSQVTTVPPITDKPTVTEKPTETPTTLKPTEKPTELPTTVKPTTEAPTTVKPTEKPTEVPTTVKPTEKPTETPTTEPVTTVPITTEPPITEVIFSDLIISEYAEGSSFNKYIEVFNGTGEPVDLSVYSIKVYSNGSSGPSNSIPLEGLLDHYDVFIIAHPSSDQKILDQANITSTNLNFNGDDVVALFYNDVLIDLIGVIGVRTDFAKDKTIVRNESVTNPSAEYNTDEWATYSMDTFIYLGFHHEYFASDEILFQQDIDALPNTKNLYGPWNLGVGKNGSTYKILSVTGDAEDYVDFTVNSNLITPTLTLDETHTGVMKVEISKEGMTTVTKDIELAVKFFVLDTDTHEEYYSSIDEGLSAETLMLALRALLQDEFSGITYGEVRYALQETDIDPNDPSKIILVYLRTSVDATWDGGATWNREHVWPQSRLAETADNNIVNMASDLHNLTPANPAENSSKGNKFLDNITTSNTYEPYDEVKGNIARMLLYMIVMYPELELIEASNGTGPQMGVLSTMLQWHILDPVDDLELHRNNVIYGYQNNRNPFIDNPEYVELIWGSIE